MFYPFPLNVKYSWWMCWLETFLICGEDCKIEVCDGGRPGDGQRSQAPVSCVPSPTPLGTSIVRRLIAGRLV